MYVVFFIYCSSSVLRDTRSGGILKTVMANRVYSAIDTISGKRHLVKKKDTMSFHPSEYLNLPKLLYSYNYR